MLRASLLCGLMVLMLAAGAVFAQSVTPVRAIRAQSLIGEADVVPSETSAAGAVAEIAAVVGQEARTTLYPGRPILSNQIGAPALVERNQLVRMHFSEGALSITTEGRTLDRAGAGELVRVMNLASRQIVTGSVLADGSIEVGQ
ncbi:MAG TPA: flagellar basal body P-ring formation chaperone FlgA [Amaricoccus sp.]|uniref:flagellar basal body P-ring formation chaperone FlgA n=1 Tax=Amaricoccus sp. TaxID=1872485 RepID=UPI002B9FE8B3|nr:flagellar basal body P-ring formation chaperone FlgA [Amaricoccus sp.]HMQ91542.1 flagellar basal body P-ring formation chaperone FlgA [Amaricoccus sp.]HMR50961.1 flagellar basal body P-ring formation chaperone FlgA [Amaricoccus sp.]HMR60448.1 flagellar basal body P-ring formation chaperone FlgA [Amaricoccus sp.]HMT97860.1 flagellar basal body P-ring formation chaperone FlgA [Amaricoccus sp.]